MTTEIVILGAGFGGLELAARLSDAVPERAHVTLIDKSDGFTFGFAKFDVMFGGRSPADVRANYHDIAMASVDFRQETVRSIDAATRRVVTDASTYDADILVVALGADLDPDATPGFVDGGFEFYSVEGARRSGAALESFVSGVAVIAVLGPFFKCPPAPNEAAFLLHDYLAQRGLRDDVEIHLLTPMPMPIPISKETSQAIMALLDDRGVHYSPNTWVDRIDPGQQVAHLRDGRDLSYDIFFGIPVHKAPDVVVESGLTEEDGWIAVDIATFATKFPGVYAVGDITSAPVPRAGVIAESEAAVLADTLIAQLTGGAPPPPYQGEVVCYIEMGGDEVARVDVNFLAGAAPTAIFKAPSTDTAAEKREFAQSRLQRWFGHP